MSARKRFLLLGVAGACVLLSSARALRGQPRGYTSRPCGFDMDRNGVLGEPPDRLVGDGVTRDPDGDGVNEDLLYVDAAGGNDTTGDGSAGRPYKTVQKALNVADGPGDGAEDIICISGVFREAVTIRDSGVGGYYTRDDFQFPRNPLMLIGWDKDGDGEYPPYDTDDIAVLDGDVGGNNRDIGIRTDSKRSYLEIAHLTVRNYGSSAHTTCGAFKLFHWGGGSQSHVYVHDVEMKSINRAITDASARIVFNFWGGPTTYIAVINSEVDEYASYFCRGSPNAPAGHYRFQNITLKMFGVGGSEPNHHSMGWKLWGTHSNVEIIDNVINTQPHLYGANLRSYAMTIGQCAQNYVIRNNEFIDCRVAVNLQGDAGSSYCQSRPVSNILIDRNIIRNTYSGWLYNSVNCISIQGGSKTTATVANVTITNNFISSTTRGACAIAANPGNDQGPQPGSVTIAGNTIYGRWVRSDGFYKALAIRASYPYKQNNWTIKNNIFANSGSGYQNIGTEYIPTNWVASGNVYDDSSGFTWNRVNISTLGGWRSATGQDADSRVGDPAFVSAGSGDFHLDPNDTVAKGSGVDITDITTWDIDGDTRDPQNPTAGADVEGVPPDTDPPTILGMASAADHGRGVGEAMLAIPDDGSFSEPRASGVSRIIVLFSETIDPVSFTPGSVEIAGLDANGIPVGLGGIAVGASVRPGDQMGEISFTPALPDYARYALRISGVRDVAGNELSGDRERILTALVGDVSGDLRVNATDFSRVRAARTRLIDPGDTDQCRADVSCDGRVNASDLSRVRMRRGGDARGIPDPVLPD